MLYSEKARKFEYIKELIRSHEQNRLLPTALSTKWLSIKPIFQINWNVNLAFISSLFRFSCDHFKLKLKLAFNKCICLE